MDSAELNDVCRLCPSSGSGEDLMHVFDERLSVKNNMKEVILVTTGVEVEETDLISKKICQRCCTKTLQMFLFRQDALTQDRALREKCSRFLEDKGIRLPNTCITIKRERRDSFVPPKRLKLEPNELPLTKVKVKAKKILHFSVAEIYKNHPQIKLPKKCLDRHLAPIVSFTMGEVEKYFKRRNLDMKKFIYKPGAKIPPRAVAKKRTSFPMKRKTVSPIKISKKVLENHDSQNTTSIDYVCTSVNKDRHRKKSLSPPHCEKQEIKITGESKETPPPTLVEMPTLTKFLSKSPPPVPIFQQPVTVSQPVIHVAQKLEVVKPTIPPTTVDPVSENNQDSCLGGTSKPEFIESLGLTPTVTATKSKMMHVCNLCGSVHNNAFKLKTHTRKHMVCQFCKLRFKSLETKQDHVDNSCHVKEIMNSPEPFVELEFIHLNLDIRKQFSDAFTDFDPIPGLLELDSIQQTNVKAAVLQQEAGDFILLSDDDGTHTRHDNPPSEALTSSLVIPPPESVSVVRPEVKIKENSILDDIIGDIGDKQIVKDLLRFLMPLRKRTVGKVLQTDLPATKDIKINNAEGYCEFKNLKEQLLSYQIPVSITDGPFHVGYQYKNTSNPTKTMALWNDISIIDVDKRALLNQSGGRKNSLLSPNSCLPTGVSSAVSNLPMSASVGNISVPSTPVLPNVAENTSTPVINKLITNSLSNPSTSRKSLSLRGRPRKNRPAPSSTLYRKSLPSNVLPINGSSSSASSKNTSLAPFNITGNSAGPQQTVNFTRHTTRSRTNSASTSASENSRVRVKNVWELQ